MNLHITPSFNIDRLCKTASVLLFLVLISLTISCVTRGRSALLLICLVGICGLDNRLTSALNMFHRWFGSLCVYVVNMLVKMAKFFLKSDQLALLYELTFLGFCLINATQFDLDFMKYYVAIWCAFILLTFWFCELDLVCWWEINKVYMLLLRVGILTIFSRLW